jgi:RNA polymerase sigma factor (sigma-70 family)
MSEVPEMKVYIVDDDGAMRESLRWLIESAGHAVETFSSASQFLALYNERFRGCLILDVRMPLISGLDLQQDLISRGVLLPVIMVSGYADIPMVVNAMQIGAIDFLEKPFNDDVLLDRINKALALSSRQSDREDMRQQFARLTEREREILQSVKKGLSSRAIAASLGISAKTVEVHRANMMHKLSVNSAAELVSMAWQAGV